MTLDKTQITNMTTRQKATAGIIVLVIIIILWQVIGLFRGESSEPPAEPAAPAVLPNKNAANPNGLPAKNASNATLQAQTTVPQPAQVPQQQMTLQQQNELMRLQQETQQKYVIALNELQMLKLSQQIAETNKSIATAKLATVTAEKGIVDLLTAPAPQIETPNTYSSGLVNPSAGGAPSPPNPPANAITAPQEVVNYIVISVSKLLDKWSAVLGYQGKLYNVFVGDVLPSDGSKVISIDRSGVVVEKDGANRKISLVPII